MNKNTCLFVMQISQSRSFYAVYMGGSIFYEEIYGMADLCIDGSINDSLFKYTEERYKRSGTDNNSCKRK